MPDPSGIGLVKALWIDRGRCPQGAAATATDRVPGDDTGAMIVATHLTSMVGDPAAGAGAAGSALVGVATGAAVVALARRWAPARSRVEDVVITGTMVTLVALAPRAGSDGWFLAVLGGLVLCAGVVDLRCRRLPNVLTLGGAAVVMASAVLLGRAAEAAIGAGALFAIHLLGHLAGRGAVGAGDVKWALAVGGAAAMRGPSGWLLAAALAPVVTALAFGAVAVLRRGRPGPRSLPHGPSMGVAALLAWVSLPA